MNTPKRDSQWMGELLGYSLGLCDAEEQQRIEAQMPDLAQRQQIAARIQQTLNPLQADRLPPPPADLSARILNRVLTANRTLQLPRLSAVAATETGTARPNGTYMAMREIVGLAASILLFVGILVPGINSARLASQRAACTSNLQQIGSGYVIYRDDNGGAWPYAGPMPDGASWLAQSETPRQSNSRNPYLLIQGRYVQPRVFVDPGRSNDIPLDPAFIKEYSDFPDRRNLGYATSFVQRPWHAITMDVSQPLVADMNPLVDDPHARTTANPLGSRSHAPAIGQNVLRQDGSVIWSRTPHAGMDGDDIYRIIGVQKYTGLERPRAESDAFLIP